LFPALFSHSQTGVKQVPNSRLLRQYTLDVAGIVIQFIAGDSFGLALPDIHRPFSVDKGEPDFRLKVHYGELPPLKLGEKLFDSGSIWTLYHHDGGYAITFSSEAFGIENPYQAVVINSTFEQGDLYIKPLPKSNKRKPPARPNQTVVSHILSLIHPLLMAILLPMGRGAEFHACGVVYKGQGLIFTGGSGSGKSTLGRLWQGRQDALVLSDERIIVRKKDDGFWMYGTPWQSDARTSSPEGAPLKRIFFISHGRENSVSPVKAGDAASKLFVRCFPAFWDETCLNFTLDFIGQIVERVPCYELGFTPDRSILDFVDDIVSRGPNP
jgi:hypothetical protein